MRPRAVVALLLLMLSTVLVATPASAQQAGGGDSTDCISCTATAVSSGGSIEVEVVRGTSEKVPGRGDGTYGEAPGRTEWKTVEEYVTPACSSNSLYGNEALCMAAFTCPADNLLRFWVWHRVTEWKAGPPVEKQVGEWYQEPGSFCLGPDDPGITDIGRVIAQVQSGFQSLPLPTAAPQVSPAPETLVNIPTRLSAGSAEPVTLTTEPLAGIVVTVTATPVAWHWNFGDGSTQVTTVPDTEHTYLKAQRVDASVRVTWNGTFTLPGSGEVFPIRTPAYVQSEPTQVEVRQARSELVRD
jgi:hypothetical protein